MRPRNVRTGQHEKQKKNMERKRAFCVKLVMASLEDKCDELMQNLPVSFVSESSAGSILIKNVQIVISSGYRRNGWSESVAKNAHA